MSRNLFWRYADLSGLKVASRPCRPPEHKSDMPVLRQLNGTGVDGSRPIFEQLSESVSALAMAHKSRRISGHKPVSAPSTPGSSASFANRALLLVRIRETLLKPLLVNALASRDTFAAPERRLSTYVDCRSEHHPNRDCAHGHSTSSA
jgi:hypothetical protein